MNTTIAPLMLAIRLPVCIVAFFQFGSLTDAAISIVAASLIFFFVDSWRMRYLDCILLILFCLSFKKVDICSGATSISATESVMIKEASVFSNIPRLILYADQLNQTMDIWMIDGDTERKCKSLEMLKFQLRELPRAEFKSLLELEWPSTQRTFVGKSSRFVWELDPRGLLPLIVLIGIPLLLGRTKVKH